MAHLRMNQSVGGVFYLPHFVAQELGAFRDEGLTVEVVTSTYGQHWPLLERGEADLTVGGPIGTMRLQAAEGRRLTNFCAAVGANPWYLVGRHPQPNFTWRDLVDRTVIDFADGATPGLCLRWILEKQGIAPDRVTFLGGLGTTREMEAFRAGDGDYLLHSLHTAMPLVTEGGGVLVQEMATPTGPVPWSAYAALPKTLSAKRAELEAFTRAIARALRWITARPAREVAWLVAGRFPTLSPPLLGDTIGRYQVLGIWPRDPLIQRADFEHFHDILMATGWLPQPVPYEDQVDTSIAAQAVAALDIAEGG